MLVTLNHTFNLQTMDKYYTNIGLDASYGFVMSKTHKYESVNFFKDVPNASSVDLHYYGPDKGKAYIYQYYFNMIFMFKETYVGSATAYEASNVDNVFSGKSNIISNEAFTGSGNGTGTAFIPTEELSSDTDEFTFGPIPEKGKQFKFDVADYLENIELSEYDKIPNTAMQFPYNKPFYDKQVIDGVTVYNLSYFNRTSNNDSFRSYIDAIGTGTSSGGTTYTLQNDIATCEFIFHFPDTYKIPLYSQLGNLSMGMNTVLVPVIYCSYESGLGGSSVGLMVRLGLKGVDVVGSGE